MVRRNDWKQAKMSNGMHLCAVCSGDESIILCATRKSEDANFIAKHLNLAADLEQLTYDFATGKTDGKEIVEYVQRKLIKI